MTFFRNAETFTCKFEITQDTETQTSTIQAPQIMLMQQFMSLMNQAANSTNPIKIKMSRDVPIYDNFDKTWISRETSIGFSNNAYLKKYPEQE